MSLLSAADRAWLESAVTRLQSFLGFPLARVAIELVDDARMISLHQKHMALATTTDVLTFVQNGQGEAIDVDIAICVDEAARRGGGHSDRLRNELLLYALHGLLHAAGHDDHCEASFTRMHQEEDRILEAAGFGRIFEGGEQ